MRIMNHNAVVSDIEKMIQNAESPLTDDCCIYRVPICIRKLKEDAYTPTVVSIGPFHHKAHPRFHNMEKHKLMYCNTFFKRTQTSLETCISHIEEMEMEPFIRGCYSETIDISREELVKIIIIDSIFILELFLRCSEPWSINDVCLTKPWLSDLITIDLLLLENQLPFPLLDTLFKLSFSYTSDGELLKLAFEYFSEYNKSNLNFDKNIKIRHFTDLLRTFNLKHPLENQSPRIKEFVKHSPTATELSEAGVRFKVNTENKCLLDLKFAGRDFEIPQLEVDDSTELLFRNMVALEQCRYPRDSYIIDYVDMLDVLLNTSKDVEILVRKKVLVNCLGNTDNVAKLFNGLMQNITVSNVSSHFDRIRGDLNDFYKNPCNKLKSTLKRDYCRTPWQVAATTAAVILLILSLLQSVCSILQVMRQ